MPSPFPGMDPFLEHPALWPDVHNGLIAELRNQLGPLLRPRYIVALEERTYLAEHDGLLFVGRPDPSVHERKARRSREDDARSLPGSEIALAVEVPIPEPVRETYLEVRRPAGDVVTVLELLSPANKSAGSGRAIYEEKRLAVLGTRTHLVEIDLIRAGRPMPIHGTDRTSDYRILVSRGDRRPSARLWLFSVRDRIPKFFLPLRAGDEEPEVDMGPLLGRLYDLASYDLRVDYCREAIPPLSPEDGAWAAGLRDRPTAP